MKSFVYRLAISLSLLLIGAAGALTILHGVIVNGSLDVGQVAMRLKYSGLVSPLVVFSLIALLGFVLLILWAHPSGMRRIKNAVKSLTED